MSQFPSRKEVERIKKMYPKGTRIQIERMNDPYHPIERGTKGTVDHVDDAGTLHCIFDNGRSLGVVTDADIFHVIDRLNVPVAERYAYLLGSAIDGNKRLHNVQEVAELPPMEDRLISLISDNYLEIYEIYSKVKSKEEKLYLRLLLVTDFICGMTDSYAKQLYQELSGIE